MPSYRARADSGSWPFIHWALAWRNARLAIGGMALAGMALSGMALGGMCLVGATCDVLVLRQEHLQHHYSSRSSRAVYF